MNARESYEQLTEKIVEQLDAGTAPWVRPWSVLGTSDMPANYATRKAYHGSNVLSLWMMQAAVGYTSNEWMTFKQGAELGATVRKGEQGAPIIFAGPRMVTAKDDDGNDKRVSAGFTLRGFTVFNLDQFDGIDRKAPPEPSPFDSIADADEFVVKIGAQVTYQGDSAFYSPATDTITVPVAQQFVDPSSFYATLLHEHAHWSGAEHRLARKFGKRFGDQAYAFEELVAELTAAFLTADLGIPGKLQHPEYLANWSKVLSDDKNALWTAASSATKAAEYLWIAASESAPIEAIEVAA